jgi:mono/diheme cytochrome c family protein
MMIAIVIKHYFQLAFISVLAMLVMTGCGQPASDPVETAAPEVAEPVNDGQLASIDADGNIAPFGMASKQPVPVQEQAQEQAAAAASAEDVATMSAVYATHCTACHGADATGVTGLGLNLVESEFVRASSEDELVAFLQAGRQPGSPDSVTSVPMPAFAWMEATDLAEVAGYIKSLQQ